MLHSILLAFLLSFCCSEELVLPMHVIIIDQGLGFGSEDLHFGVVNPGGTSVKKIVIVHSYNISKEIDINLKGRVGRYVVVDQNNFILEPLQNRTVSFTFEASDSMREGEYNGEVRIGFS